MIRLLLNAPQLIYKVVLSPRIHICGRPKVIRSVWGVARRNADETAPVMGAIHCLAIRS